MTFCMFVDCMYYVLRAPRKIGAKPIGLPSLNKVFTYLLTYLLVKTIFLALRSVRRKIYFIEDFKSSRLL